MRAMMGFATALTVCSLLGAAEEAKKASPGAAKGASAPPRAVYQHTTANGRTGKFELNGPTGTADYYFNGQHHQDGLVYKRSAEMSGPGMPGAVAGHVYQVTRDGKDQPLWFFFGDQPLAESSKAYAMYYSVTPPNNEGKQPWNRIRTPNGTERLPLGKSKARSKDEL